MKRMIFLTLLILQQISNLKSEQEQIKTCRALVLEGGGDKGSYQAGVLKGFIDNLSPDQVQYDVVTGISVGSLNGAFISSFAKGDEQNMASNLISIWETISQSDVWQNWGGTILGVAEGFTIKEGIFDNSPLRKFLEEQLANKTIQRKFTVGVTDATNAEFMTYDLDNNQYNLEQVISHIIASASIPVVFPYQTFNDNANSNSTSFMVDGGVMVSADFDSAIERCKEIVDDEANIIVDAILCHGNVINKLDSSQNITSMQMLYRLLQIMIHKNSLQDMLNAKNSYPSVNFRHIVYPTSPITSFLDQEIPITFDHDQIMSMIARGESDAKAAIQDPTKCSMQPTSIQKRRIQYKEQQVN